ncbi:MAG: hypothetical protein J0I98_22415 [Mesorhizobium sp.]|nr:hypothetical protein [Mesorhizobium sp.]MBN9245538.1 hypothetical protein [Mesorhizobium sp.]
MPGPGCASESYPGLDRKRVISTVAAAAMGCPIIETEVSAVADLSVEAEADGQVIAAERVYVDEIGPIGPKLRYWPN